MYRSAFCLAPVLAAVAAGADGPGIGNVAWPSASVGAVVSRINTANGAPRGHGFPVVHRGRMWVIFSNDGGGGAGSGGFAVYEAANPAAPQLVMTTVGSATYAVNTANDATNIREAHAISLSGDVACVPTNKGAATGLQFWDWSSATAPRRISQIALPGMIGGDYTSTPWWQSWQGRRWTYVAGAAAGLYLVDATDPANPVMVDRGPGRPNPIPTSALGGFRVNVCWAIGNLLVLTNADQLNGISILDISDPGDPVLRWSTTSHSVGYSAYVAGDRIYAAHNPPRVWDISSLSAPVLLGQGAKTIGTGGYGMVQDDRFIYGGSSAVAGMTITGSAPFPIPFQVTPAGFTGIDWDFAMPIGNLVWAGNDHGGGSGLLVHRSQPDTTGPAVTMVNPRNGSTYQPTHSRVGLVFGDLIDGRSLSQETIIVRPVGGDPVPGTWSVQLGVVNFWPDAPFLPDTTYEVVVPAGGVTDVSGNGALPFTSQFTTSGIEPALVVDATTLAVPEGATAAVMVRLAQAPAGTVLVATTRTAGDGDLSVTAGAALTFTPTTWDIPQAVVVAAAPDADDADGAATLSLYAIGHAGAAVRVTEVDGAGGGGEGGTNLPPAIPVEPVAEPADLAL